MIEPFLITNNLMDYVDGSISCPSKTLSVTDGVSVQKENPNYPIWVSNDAYDRMLIISTISEASFRHVQGTTSRDLWLSLKKVYAPHSTSREYTLKTQLLRIKMHGDETPDAYLNRAQEYAMHSPPLMWYWSHSITCPNRDPSTIRTRPSANFANTRAQSFNASANWHSDTGADSHVTPDLEAMDNS
nr:uncharacterized protein [Tanacetum cinerariifolium]